VDARSLFDVHPLFSGPGQPQDPATTSYITSLDRFTASGSGTRSRDGIAWSFVGDESNSVVDLDADQRSELRDHTGTYWVNQFGDINMPYRLKEDATRMT
jgi:hypothetical protein